MRFALLNKFLSLVSILLPRLDLPLVMTMERAKRCSLISSLRLRVATAVAIAVQSQDVSILDSRPLLQAHAEIKSRESGKNKRSQTRTPERDIWKETSGKTYLGRDIWTEVQQN